MLRKRKNIRKEVNKIQKYKKNNKNKHTKTKTKQNKKKMSERMAQGKQEPKLFERNPCIIFRDNCDTDGGRTDGSRTNFDFMSSADIVKQN